MSNLAFSASTSTPVATTKRSVCSKCGISKNSGKANCCAPGGDWFADCSIDVNPNFGHTFKEGIQACKSKFI